MQRLFLGAWVWAMGCLFSVGASAQPSEKQCRRLWRKGPQEKVLRCLMRGGERAVRRLGGRRYRSVVGTCWDYDVIVQQACGCRMFRRASICCWRDQPNRCPDFRVGASGLVDCKKFGAPRYGSSGMRQNEICKRRATKAQGYAHCRRLRPKAFAFFDCRDAVLVHCKKESQYQPIYNSQCGPGVKGCRGCRLVEECSKKRGLQCYREGFARWAAKQQQRSPLPPFPRDTDPPVKPARKNVYVPLANAKQPHSTPLPRRTSLDATTMQAFQRLFSRLNKATFDAQEPTFRSEWHPTGYAASLSGFGYYAGKAIYRTCKAYRYQLLANVPAARLVTHKTKEAWLIPVRYREQGKPYDAEHLWMLAIQTNGLWRILAAHKQESLLRSVAQDWLQKNP